jgi:primosomal protein N' (replication factor Y)
MADQYYQIVPTNYTGTMAEFTYHGPAGLEAGQLVQIQLGRRPLTGIIKTVSERKPSFATKPITAVLDLPPLPEYLQNLALWLSQYYAASLTMVWNTFLPTGLTKVRRVSKPVKPKPAQGLPPLPLTADQANALKTLENQQIDRVLLEGITGSGKTRVYLESAARTLANGQSVLVLVPEITLTPQLVDQFESTFGTQMVLASHSKLTEANRHAIWVQALQAATAQEPRIIIGPRSCLFLPVSKLGLIIVDECHETSYKQDRQPRYHAIAVATYVARLCQAQLILGSATPSVNEQFMATNGRLTPIIMANRANNISQPKSTIIDLRNKELFKKRINMNICIVVIISWPVVGLLTGFIILVKSGLFKKNRVFDRVDLNFLTLLTLFGYISPVFIGLMYFLDKKFPVGEGERDG